MPSPTGGPAAPKPSSDALIRLVVEKGWATRDQIQAAVQYQARKKVSIAEAFIELSILSEAQVRRALGGPKAPPPVTTEPHPLADAIKGYRILKCLGSGGMGDVYLAKQTSLDRLVALKVLPAHFSNDEAFIERFVIEARAAGKVFHENIVAGVDIGESNGRYFFAMEYVQGPTLRQLIQKTGALAEDRALDIACQVAAGLKHAYLHGLVHRDIKPANIMIAPGNIAKICDFGLARDINDSAKTTGVVQSSPAYASPEQGRGRPDADHRSDMYSLGVTLFEMFTGERPFHADTPAALLAKHATVAPPSVDEIRPDLAPASIALVKRLLRKDPKQRFETYDQLIEAIQEIEESSNEPESGDVP